MSGFHLFNLTLPISSWVVKKAAVQCNNSGQHLKKFKNQHVKVLLSLVQLILKIMFTHKRSNWTNDAYKTMSSACEASSFTVSYGLDPELISQIQS